MIQIPETLQPGAALGALGSKLRDMGARLRAKTQEIQGAGEYSRWLEEWTVADQKFRLDLTKKGDPQSYADEYEKWSASTLSQILREVKVPAYREKLEATIRGQKADAQNVLAREAAKSALQLSYDQFTRGFSEMVNLGNFTAAKDMADQNLAAGTITQVEHAKLLADADRGIKMRDLKNAAKAQGFQTRWSPGYAAYLDDPMNTHWMGYDGTEIAASPDEITSLKNAIRTELENEEVEASNGKIRDSQQVFDKLLGAYLEKGEDWLFLGEALKGADVGIEGADPTVLTPAHRKTLTDIQTAARDQALREAELRAKAEAEAAYRESYTKAFELASYGDQSLAGPDGELKPGAFANFEKADETHLASVWNARRKGEEKSRHDKQWEVADANYRKFEQNAKAWNAADRLWFVQQFGKSIDSMPDFDEKEDKTYWKDKIGRLWDDVENEIESDAATKSDLATKAETERVLADPTIPAAEKEAYIRAIPMIGESGGLLTPSDWAGALKKLNDQQPIAGLKEAFDRLTAKSKVSGTGKGAVQPVITPDQAAQWTLELEVMVRQSRAAGKDWTPDEMLQWVDNRVKQTVMESVKERLNRFNPFGVYGETDAQAKEWFAALGREGQPAKIEPSMQGRYDAGGRIAYKSDKDAKTVDDSERLLRLVQNKQLFGLVQDQRIWPQIQQLGYGYKEAFRLWSGVDAEEAKITAYGLPIFRYGNSWYAPVMDEETKRLYGEDEAWGLYDPGSEKVVFPANYPTAPKATRGL